MNKLLSLPLVLASVLLAQTKVWDKKVAKSMSSSAILLLQIVDIDAVKDEGYILNTTKAGIVAADSTLYAWDILTGNTEYTHKLPSLNASSQSTSIKTQYVQLMKNLFSSNNEWSMVRSYHDAKNNMTIDFFNNGKATFSASFISNPTFYKFGNSLYMYGVSAVDTTHVLYKIRSDLIVSIGQNSKANRISQFSFSRRGNKINITQNSHNNTSFTWKILNLQGQELASGKSINNGNTMLANLTLDFPVAPYFIYANSNNAIQIDKIAVLE